MIYFICIMLKPYGIRKGKSPIDKYSFTKQTSQDDSTKRNLRKYLDEALNYGNELLNRCEKNESDLQKKEERISSITKENSQLKHKLTKVGKKLQDSTNKVSVLKQQVTNNKQYIRDLNQQLAYEQKYIQKQTSELHKLKLQYIDIKTTSSQNEVSSQMI
jgi:predicted nuclease with TOPRIM domain